MGEFHSAMKAAHVQALWEINGRNDVEQLAPHVWRWGGISPLLDGAVAATSMDAERRVLLLSNPAFAGTSLGGAGLNLGVNLQVLMPGESARPHRHTMHAIRFVLEGEGVETVVEGKTCRMGPGDLVLTPGMTWHEHVHRGKGRCVWIDALDVPLQRYLGTLHFEPGPVHDLLAVPPDAAFRHGGMTGLDRVGGLPFSPLFRYAWSDAEQALAELPPEKDGSKRLRYTNPVTGEAVLPTVDCALWQLKKQAPTQRVRSNSESVFVVFRGAGESQVGSTRIAWSDKDVFTAPHGSIVQHRGVSEECVLFEISDREVLRRLGLLRESVMS